MFQVRHEPFCPKKGGVETKPSSYEENKEEWT
jgi:hypothetical protein